MQTHIAGWTIRPVLASASKVEEELWAYFAKHAAKSFAAPVCHRVGSVLPGTPTEKEQLPEEYRPEEELMRRLAAEPLLMEEVEAPPLDRDWRKRRNEHNVGVLDRERHVLAHSVAQTRLVCRRCLRGSAWGRAREFVGEE